MAEAAVLATLGWVASPLVKMLFDKAEKLLGTSMDEKKEILAASALPRLYLAIEKAERSPKKGMLEAWLKKLKRAYYQAEDAIDLLEYQKLHLKVMEDRKTLTQTLKFEAKKLIRDVSEKLKGYIDEIIEIANEAEKFSDLLKDLENDCTSNPDRVTTAQPLGKVFGLEEETRTVVDHLTSDILKNSDQALDVGPSARSAIPIKIIAITGRSGIGKTTLAQNVYQLKDIQTYFDLVLWVHTPRKFEAIDVVKNIVQTIQKKNDAMDKGNYDSSAPLEALREQMQGMLGSKKFLLVLDDFWCDDENFIDQWEKFISCLRGWSPYSKILLTTQYERVKEKARLAGETEVTTHTAGELKAEELLELFMYHAWPRNSSKPRERFEIIGRKIVSKLKGDPGATKMVGQQLSNKLDIMHWNDIAERDWLGDKMKARIWSYQQLPTHLQRCFAFCSLYPKIYGVTRFNLIRLWMAEGFINPIDEDTGKNYLEELVSLFFLEKYVHGGYTYYRLHDLLHDLAERVKGDDVVRIDYTNSTNVLEDINQKLSHSPENIRHISLSGSMFIKLKDKISLMKNVCTLICTGSTYIPIPEKDLREILKNLEKLRVLHLPLCGGDLPNSIGNLKHLRILRFGDSSLPLNELRNSICKLYLLQSLYLPGCQSLPKEFSQLVSLRDIIVKGEALSHVSDIGRLTSLQHLDKFNVIRNKAGHELHQLENLNQLKGTMCIAGLENVASINDANKAKLKSKGRLKKLEFHWSYDERVTNNDFQLLDALRPHSNIMGLKIKSFKGNKFPSWLLCQNSTLEHLVHLQLENCSNVEEISSIGKSLPNCKVLDLSVLNKLKELPLLPPNLISLTLNYIPQLSYFSMNDLSLKDERKRLMLVASNQTREHMKSRYEQELFPEINAIWKYLNLVSDRCLHILQVGEMDNIVGYSTEELWKALSAMRRKLDFEIGLQNNGTTNLLEAMDVCMWLHSQTMLNKNDESKLILPSFLIQLTIESCSITNDALSNCIECLHSLSELPLVEIHTITSLPSEGALSALKKLSSLHIETCFLLSSLGGISALSSLTKLDMLCCLNLNSSNKLPSSLKNLRVDECAYIEDIIDQSNLPVLRDLVVKEFSKIGLNYERRGKGVLNVGSLHSLKQIFYDCSDHVYLEGLNSLTSLDTLGFRDRIRLSSVTNKCSIPIKGVASLSSLWLKEMLSDETLSSIEYLQICNCEENSLDDEMIKSLKSLKQLQLQDCNNITHLPVQLMELTSLEFLGLNNCPNLHEIESFPKNLSYLHIKNCPTLLAKFNKCDDSYKVEVHEGWFLVKFRKDQTMPGPSQPTQEASTSQQTQHLSPSPDQEVLQIPTDQLQSSTTTEQPETAQHGSSQPAQQPLRNPRRGLRLRVPRLFRSLNLCNMAHRIQLNTKSSARTEKKANVAMSWSSWSNRLTHLPFLFAHPYVHINLQPVQFPASILKKKKTIKNKKPKKRELALDLVAKKNVS
ncbi:Disease resistance protein RGA2 [Rhynchospora pubera]|uniref:Disease resistance protein RGA2 n=1 Tax=Rhynchospora pubera TaxID=906938 RepID=A0AAV8HY21_9POAL|nr:Disease resistance protein RGA2 [Rhynchospora pubera]KAJ4820681.1 Disease resistance protein RGA2 [Rhynchospora pubera]